MLLHTVIEVLRTWMVRRVGSGQRNARSRRYDRNAHLQIVCSYIFTVIKNKKYQLTFPRIPTVIKKQKVPVYISPNFYSDQKQKLPVNISHESLYHSENRSSE
jgi:hypothetical protein